ncbi:Ras association domain-containing protein 7 [Oryzias melastigma]|uniref:Ras association domain-containing protein 7 n=1 Tax=Oryzias melastigma TaxID=30732 RepID=A0A834BVS6_ORYME|nr:Ras association domain-containing protein 7 [Oryzias melastigma]
MFYACQAKNEEVEELNKELRQCNLQQFIQQTGVVPSHTHSRSDLQEQLELTHYLQDGFQDGQSAAPEEYPSRPTLSSFWDTQETFKTR